MSNRCGFSYGPVDIPADAQKYAAQCPDCGAIRETVKRGSGRVFPPHVPLDASPQKRACWKQVQGAWVWKPITFNVTTMRSDDCITMVAEEKGDEW